MLNALRAFAAIYEAGGIRPAARSLRVTHSSVSRHLRELEAWVGVPLVERREGIRSIGFTPQGEELGRAALAGFRDLESAVTNVREVRRGNAVTLSTTPSFAARWLLPRLPSFEQDYPWIELSIIVDQKLTDPTDIGIRMGKGPWSGLDCWPLMDDLLYPVMSRAYWEEVGRPSKIAELENLRLLHDRDPNAAWETWRSAHGVAGLDVRAGPRYASSDLVLRAAGQGLGVALARDRLVAAEIDSGSLLRPFGDLSVAVSKAYWIVIPQDAAPRLAVDAAIDWLKSQTLAALPQMDLGVTQHSSDKTSAGED